MSARGGTSKEFFNGWYVGLTGLTVVLGVLGGSRRGTLGGVAVFLLELFNDFI